MMIPVERMFVMVTGSMEAAQTVPIMTLKPSAVL